MAPRLPRDRLVPVAVIPVHTPDEARAELDVGVGELGFRAELLAGRVATYVDNLVMESPFDYDLVWRQCTELGVVAAFHSGAMGWGSRSTPTNATS